MKRIRAKYSGDCKGCHGDIRQGEWIRWAPGKGAYHDNCAPSSDAQADQEYWQGRAEGNRYSQERQIYGDELAEQFALEDELARYNRGENCARATADTERLQKGT